MENQARVAVPDKDNLSQFTKIWRGGYYEGDPLDPMSGSTYGVYGYNSILYTVFSACIRPYITANTSVLEIGPGRGAWTKAFLQRGCRKVYAVDAAPAEHTGFWNYIGRNDRTVYIVSTDLSLTGVPDGGIDFFFSFGVFCHLTPAQCEQYVQALASKMRDGSRGFLMISDFDKYNRCLDSADQLSLKKLFRWQTRKALLPVGAAYLLVWHLCRPFLDLRRVDKDAERNLVQKNGLGGWHHWGLDRACAALEKAGFEIVEADVEVNPRDPIVHFRKPGRPSRRSAESIFTSRRDAPPNNAT
jgi:hypothetical protein